MTASGCCIEKIKEFEGLRLTAYNDGGGVRTIGYGHTSGVKAGQTITKEQANSFLAADVASCEEFINSLELSINQNQFDALVDFCFNLGQGTLASSTLLKKIRAGAADEEIQSEFNRWVYITLPGGKKEKAGGLIRRRAWEAEMWIKTNN
ncbi:MAG: lysozyme [Prevotella sp.]|nr:lysozyme [Prevotella sp.]